MWLPLYTVFDDEAGIASFLRTGNRPSSNLQGYFLSVFLLMQKFFVTEMKYPRPKSEEFSDTDASLDTLAEFLFENWMDNKFSKNKADGSIDDLIDLLQ